MAKKFKKKIKAKGNTKHRKGTSNSADKDEINKEKIKLTGVSFNITILDSKRTKEEDTDNDKNKLIDDLVKNGTNFKTVLQMLWKYISSIGLLAETTSITSMGTLVILLDEIKHVAKNRKDKPLAELEIEIKVKDNDDKEKIKKQKVKIYNHSHLLKVFEFKQHNQAALSILHDTAIQQLINAWEKLLADILNWYYENNQEKITKNKSLSYNKILQFSNLNEAKQAVIDLEVKDFLTLNISEQLKFLNKSFGINFQSSFQKTDCLIELIQTRHLIVHYGGIVTNEYLNKLKKLKNRKLDTPDLGTKINLTPNYIISSWGTIYVAGVMLTHLIAKKSNQESHKIFDNFLNNAAFQNIQKRQLKSAIILLEYANNTHIQDTKLLWTVKLNLAQAYKWDGEEEKCDKIINSGEWDVANILFELCVSSLKNCPEEFAQNLKEAAQKGKIEITELYEWPIFHTMRKHDDFNKWIEDAFGYKLNKYRELINHKILDYTPGLTAKMLTNYFKGECGTSINK